MVRKTKKMIFCAGNAEWSGNNDTARQYSPGELGRKIWHACISITRPSRFTVEVAWDALPPSVQQRLELRQLLVRDEEIDVSVGAIRKPLKPAKDDVLYILPVQRLEQLVESLSGSVTTAFLQWSNTDKLTHPPPKLRRQASSRADHLSFPPDRLSDRSLDSSRQRHVVLLQPLGCRVPTACSARLAGMMAITDYAASSSGSPAFGSFLKYR
jgi:hypothetical protein